MKSIVLIVVGVIRKELYRTIIPLIAGLAVIFFFMTLGPRKENAASIQISGTINANPTPDTARLDVEKVTSRLSFGELVTTNRILKAMSSTNTPFQWWAKNFMLSNVNEFLGKVSVFGLSGPLNTTGVIATSYLTINGAELWLHTESKSHRMRYQNGVLWEVIALEGDCLGIGHDSEKVANWPSEIGPWSKEMAIDRMAETMTKLGLGKSEFGIAGAPDIVAPIAGGDGKTAIPFYAVTLCDSSEEPVLEARFRWTQDTGWQLTYWGNYSRRTQDAQSTNFQNLYSRFFGSGK